MDTKPLELEALCHIQSLVSRFGYSYTNPNYDKKGGDFFIIKEGTENICYSLKCQSKGRKTFPNSSLVKIPHGYVVENFLVFVYVRPENPDETKTYLYTANDIRSTWKFDGKNFSLKLSKDFIDQQENEKYYFDNNRSKIISELLEYTGRRMSYELFHSVDYYYLLWQKRGIIPSIEYIRDVFENDDLYDIFDTRKFIFLLCVSVIQNSKEDDRSLSIDWAFWPLKDISSDNCKNLKFNDGPTHISATSVTYSKTWVSELLSNEDYPIGFHLHIGDKEESVDAYVLKNGEYGVTYQGS